MGEWMPRHDAILQQVLKQLLAHAGLQLPNVNALLVLEVYTLPGGYGSILCQEETVEGKSLLVPVGCFSTTKNCRLESKVEKTLAA